MSEKEIISINSNPEYDRLLMSVGTTLEQGRRRAVAAVNAAMVQTYWEIGRQIVEYEQHGNEKAEYGSGLLSQLAKDLTIHYGGGFSLSNINKMRKMYLTYPILQTVSAKLTWSHYLELLKIDDPLERAFYEKECEAEHWGVRELKRQMKSMLSHRPAARIKTSRNDMLPLMETPETDKPVSFRGSNCVREENAGMPLKPCRQHRCCRSAPNCIPGRPFHSCFRQ